MIFVTVGAQMPFDRLIEAVDRWAGERGRSDVFAQTGDGTYRPTHIGHVRHLEPQDFRARVVAADFIVAHAGMGSILTALELGKPILVMPRRGHLMETRNDHQVATAKRLLTQGKVTVAFDEAHLAEKLDNLERLPTHRKISRHASPRLIEALRGFIHTGERAAADRGAAMPVGLAGEMADFVVAQRPQGARRAEEGAVLVNG